MRTISVREAAAALGITARAVTYRIEKGQLKGTLTKNEFGVPEWRIYPNKQILQGLNDSQPSDPISQTSFEPTDVVDAVSVNGGTPAEGPEPEQRSFATDFQAIVEQCVRPLVEEVKAQTLALAEKDRIIEEQGRQLRLLPDLQKRAEVERQLAETERQAAEVRALEVEALKKQIAALDEQRLELEAKAGQATELAGDLRTLKAKVEELQRPWWKRWFAPTPAS